MIVCPACGFDAPEDFAFCPKCGTPFTEKRPLSEERKVVTTLICDLVAFTAMSEAADPEDVDRLLGEYSERTRKVIENHGGTVEKFIGDAVVGVFGVPAVHEDDPERAVRAGLRLIEALEGMTRPDGSPLQARVGINTGEALVRLDVDPASGRGFLTGDSVNVAARLQAAAPPSSLAVGALTHELTQRVIVYEELPPVVAKGKAEPVAAWLALSPVSRTGAGRADADATPFVGREMELRYLGALFDRVASSSSPQFALLVGEPGIGKSRLVRQFFEHIDSRPELITWRQGHCLPYGEGVTYWALAEIAKAHAGILETDPPTIVDLKLDAVLPEGLDREWFRQRLRALVGLEAPRAERDENFAAWLRFLEDLAGSDPTVLVFEDLQWADQALLSFLEYVAVHASPVPLLVIGTARPELPEQHPSFVAAPRINRISVEPLSGEETTALVTSVLGDVAAEVSAGIVRRAEGNPFYAEESARLVVDRARLEDIPLAGSVQAVIAARLDALSADLKAVLADAAVVGEVFWPGAVAVLGERSEQETDALLRGLAAKQLVHRVRASTMAGEREYAFGHALARDVAYAQLPRARRAHKHAAVASWIETKTGEDPGDLAEVLAHHYSTAVEYAQATDQETLAGTLVDSAVRYLMLGGERTQAVDVAAAERHYARALRLAPAEHPKRPTLLRMRGMMLDQAGRWPEAVEVLDEAVAALDAIGDLRGLALAQGRLWGVLYAMRDPRSAKEAAALPAVLARLEAAGPSPELVRVLTDWGLQLWVVDADPQACLEAIDKALDTAEKLKLPEPAHALFTRASARLAMGDLRGLEDMDASIRVAQAQGLGEELDVAMSNRAVGLSLAVGIPEAAKAFAEARDLARRHGREPTVLLARANLVECLAELGSWEEALAEADAVVSACEAVGEQVMLMYTRTQQVRVLTLQGRAELARGHLKDLDQWVKAGSHWEKSYAVLTSAPAYRQLGELDVALGLLTEWASQQKAADCTPFGGLLPEAVRTALAADDLDLAAQVMSGIESLLPVLTHPLTSADALIAEARGELETAAAGFADAATRWHDFGVPYEEAQALLGQGRCLLALGKAEEVRRPLRGAREIFERLAARPALKETDELLDGPAKAPQV